MRTITCIGYEGHPCSTVVECTVYNRKRCFHCAREQRALRTKRTTQRWRKEHLTECREYDRQYKKNHAVQLRNSGREYQRKYNRMHPERTSVRNHWESIFRKDKPSYKGMSFFDDWNPKKGGSFKAGGDWIVANLGKRPEGCTLHVIEHEKGFVPGNLEWTHPRKQTNQQMFKIIAQQKHTIRQLEERIHELESLARAA